MTEPNTEAFLARFARDYDLPAAARAAGISCGAAHRLLTENAAALDSLIRRRTDGDTLAAIRQAYTSIAFGETEEVRPGDRIRALELLRLMSTAGGEDSAPALTVRREYV